MSWSGNYLWKFQNIKNWRGLSGIFEVKLLEYEFDSIEFKNILSVNVLVFFLLLLAEGCMGQRNAIAKYDETLEFRIYFQCLKGLL